MPKPRLLVSNDDGVRAPGIAALASELRKVGDVTVVAPDRERSAASHSLTVDVPLRADYLADDVIGVAGTPTDCVLLAIENLLHERPHVVVSGINRGPNVGNDVTYSGTVAAAMEATILGVPAMAVSLGHGEDGEYDYACAARVAGRLTRLILDNGLPGGTLLNVNVPNLPEEEIDGIEVARLGKQVYEDSIVPAVDPRGRTYYWIGGSSSNWKEQHDTDIAALNRGNVALTPIHLDLTDYATMQSVSRWPLEGVAGSTKRKE
ncbi:MAG: 5'/3'-nucleotidase SurE [Candidatus Eisenbacteria bacterium]|nr:5'/3'-nucleotidase SurE [Candidatus Eisenbacteria bacterium]